MRQSGSQIVRGRTAQISLLRNRPRVLISGACRGVGQACAEALAEGGAELILCDRDASGLREISDALGAIGIPCDVASETSVASFAADLSQRFASLDMVINAAGGGYERTLGMYRMSRALLPALQRGTYKLLLNVPPSLEEAKAAIFPYTSSRLGFERLSSALAFETSGMSVAVMIACPGTRRIVRVLPDPDAGGWIDTYDLRRPGREDVLSLAVQVASLVGRSPASRRQAG